MTRRPQRNELLKGTRHVRAERVFTETVRNVDGAAVALDIVPAHVADLEPAIAADLSEQLRPALRRLRRLDQELAARGEGAIEGQPCVWCARPVPPSDSGRAKLYCGRSCRQRAYEARKNSDG